MRIGIIAPSAVAIVAIGAGIVALQWIDASAGEALLPYDDPVTVASGKVLYEDNCASCHGADLEGQPDWQIPDQDGFMPAPPHDKTGHTWHHPDSQLLEIIAKGGTLYDGTMPGFEDELSIDERAAILIFIKSTWQSDSREYQWWLTHTNPTPDPKEN